MVRVFSLDELEIRVWNPSSGELIASATGAAAAVIASTVHGFSDREVLVHNRGGDLFVRWDEESNDVMISAPVDYTFMGTYYWDLGEGVERQ
jgi:diaminopimelate epimerase